MRDGSMFDLAVVATLLPATWVSWRRQEPERDGLFWGVVGLAIAGPLLREVSVPGNAWQTSLSETLWVSITASAVVFAGGALINRAAWRLLPLLMPYLVVLALIAVLERKGQSETLVTSMAWLEFHIVVSVATYAILTVAAVAALATFLQEVRLKGKRPPMALSERLPSVADAEALSGYLLATSQISLGLGLASGMAVQYLKTGVLLRFDHKALLSLLVFAIISILLLVRRLTGVRGRMAARVVLLAYLLLTLAYPGVKFVTDVFLEHNVS